MAFIEISDLNAAGNDLSPVADSFLTKLGQAASRQIFGGRRSRCITVEPTPPPAPTWCCWTTPAPELRRSSEPRISSSNGSGRSGRSRGR